MSAAERDDARYLPTPPAPWTQEQYEGIKGFVTAGLSLPIACEANGLKWTTVRHWMTHGRKGLVPWVQFVEMVDKAKAMHEAVCKVAIAKHMAKDWRAAAWALEKLESKRALDRARGRARDEGDEQTICMYPVPMPLGAAPDQSLGTPTPAEQMPPDDDASDTLPATGHAFDVLHPDDQESDDEFDDDD